MKQVVSQDKGGHTQMLHTIMARQQQRGYSLLECCLVLAMMSILLSLSTPSYCRIYQHCLTKIHDLLLPLPLP